MESETTPRRRRAERESVVLVHGLWMPGWEAVLMRRRLGAAGFATRQFTYRSVTETPDDAASRLCDFVAATPGRVVHLLGHSLGGVLAVKAFGGIDHDRVGRVVCLGSPFQGSHAGRRLARLPGGGRMLGASGPAFRDAPVTRWSGDTELGIIAGSRTLGGGVLLGGLSRPNDGTVAVAETRLEGATDHLVLPVNHFSLLWSKEVAERVVNFLRYGRFEPQRSSRQARHTRDTLTG